ncbi:MAG: aspartate aminotransferase family protein [Verrucomicrobiota bacterium]|nr:aspartate aminotransferase family protein [Verrucomicrobiota bacterium]
MHAIPINAITFFMGGDVSQGIAFVKSPNKSLLAVLDLVGDNAADCNTIAEMTESQRVLRLLRQFESRNVTFVSRDGSWPIVWSRAKGVRVWDADGRRYVDLTAGFGVANTGHANARVVKAAKQQISRLPHAMGDVHPHPLKAELARTLSQITFERWRCGQDGKTVFGNSGFEAVEAALKTAMLATGRPGVIVFEGAYHGLGYGALTVTHRDFFRAPFIKQLGGFACFAPFPLAGPIWAVGASAALHEDQVKLEKTMTAMERIAGKRAIGAVLVEPVQGRAGIRIPVRGFLSALRSWCDANDVLLILDEIYTGFGRTGAWFACEHENVVPDLVCLGKALTGGFPLSACVGKADLMDAAWPEATGEAIHTSTFLGNPIGCAMALAQIGELKARGLIERSARLGKLLLEQLRLIRATSRLILNPRGIGLMAGLELLQRDCSPATSEAVSVMKEMLRCGYIILAEGEFSNVLSIAPPLTIGAADIQRAVHAIEQALLKCAR